MLAKNFSRSALFHMKTRVSLKYFMTDCRCSLEFRGGGFF